MPDNGGYMVAAYVVVAVVVLAYAASLWRRGKQPRPSGRGDAGVPNGPTSPRPDGRG